MKIKAERLQALWDAADKMVATYGTTDPETGERSGAVMAGPLIMEPLEVQGLVEEIWMLEALVEEPR